MKFNAFAVALLIAAVLLILPRCKNQSNDLGGVPPSEATTAVIGSPFSPNSFAEPKIRFPDFGFMLPVDSIDSRVFLLSQDFPKEKPALDDAVKKILEIDFKKDWEAYLIAVRDYVLKGNANPDDYENSFYLEDNKVHDWYHVPWQHWGPNGREGIHGLTQEGPINEKMLAPSQTSACSHAYAVGFYNNLGGWTIGQMWNDVNEPSFDYFINGGGFPIGTVVGKVLFTTLDVSEVPYLTNPVSWNAYVYKSDLPNVDCNKLPKGRTEAKVNLIQMDIMVRDERAKETGGWVFGNFVYNGNLNNHNRWENLQPLGIMWGNDPDVTLSSYNMTPTKTIINPALKETIINPSETMPAMHLGWGSRLNGPVDGPQSSCMSCHSTAQYPGVSAIMPFLNSPAVNMPEAGTTASAAWMRWFRNVGCATPFDPGKAFSLDYSLQLQKSVDNYLDYLNKTTGGMYYLQYWDSPHKVTRNVFN